MNYKIQKSQREKATNIFKDIKSLFKLKEYFLNSGEKGVSFYMYMLMSAVHRERSMYVPVNYQTE